jgi:uncharacterized protein (DUF433 family)/DNA-binding transcriptional MerR regulator
MDKLVSHNKVDHWRRRLTLPAYQVKEAAHYAGITTRTILNWQKDGIEAGAALSERDKRVALSYLQLVEVAFVAALRKVGVRLEDIRNAHDYIGQKLHSEYPFADYRFKTDGKDIFMELDNFVKKGSGQKLVVVSKGGQIGWSEILKHKFEEFDYLENLAICWRPAGKGSPIKIDPRVSFGAPTVKGVPTWAIRGRWDAGENKEDIADDFRIEVPLITQALQFEHANLVH